MRDWRPGLWAAKETGARLIGIDLSPIGIERATERATALGLSKRASFRQGSFASTGLHTAATDAVMTVDALQYAPDKPAAIAEIARIIRPGGRFCCVAFELDAERVEGMGVWEDASGITAALEGAGFEVVTYDQLPG